MSAPLPGPDGPNPVAPPWLNNGDNAWQLTAATLVGLQSIPGLMVLYAGIVKKKWAVNSAFMCFYAFAMVLICWVTYAFRMAFGEQWIPICGRPGSAISMDRELQQSYLPAAGVGQAFPLSTMVYFQFVFAAITLIILAGALLGRMNIVAWMMFVPLWLTFSYTIVAFSIWGGGYLYKRGVVDYSGGYVIHLSSGTAGFVAAYWVGPRTDKDRADFQPNNVLVAMIGAGILWTGWNGFNGGDPYTASPDAGAAVLNTNIATAMSLLCWTALDIAFFKKPSIIGSVQGMITGLVAITPAAGVVAGWGAIIIGFASGTFPWISMNVAGRKLGLFRIVDDTLGVFHTHMVAGFIGGMCVGFFATGSGDAAFALTNPGGAIDGNWKQVWLQLVGALFVVGWNIAVTSIILLLIRLVVPLRMSEEALEIGDDAVHGEEAYAFYGDGRRVLHHGDFVRPAGDAEMGVLAGHDPMVGNSNGDEIHAMKAASEGKSSGSGSGEAGLKRD